MKGWPQRIPVAADGSFDLPEGAVIVQLECVPTSFDDPGTARAVWIIQQEEVER